MGVLSKAVAVEVPSDWVLTITVASPSAAGDDAEDDDGDDGGDERGRASRKHICLIATANRVGNIQSCGTHGCTNPRCRHTGAPSFAFGMASKSSCNQINPHNHVSLHEDWLLHPECSCPILAKTLEGDGTQQRPGVQLLAAVQAFLRLSAGHDMKSQAGSRHPQATHLARGS